MQITPGYNHEPNEVPTKAKLQLMTTGMVITGIDISQIATTLVGTKFGDTSVSLPAEGWFQISPQGMLWIKNRWGRCPVYRPGWGGMAMNRIGNLGAPGYVSMAAAMSQITTHPAASVVATGPSCAAMLLAQFTNVQDFRRPLDSAVSNAHTVHLLFGGAVWPTENPMLTWGKYKLARCRYPDVPSNGGSGWDPVPYSSLKQVNGIILTVDTCITSTFRRALGISYGNFMNAK